MVPGDQVKPGNTPSNYTAAGDDLDEHLDGINTALGPIGTLGGDLSGTLSAATVAKVQGNAFQSGSPTAFDTWVWTGSQWEHTEAPSHGIVVDSSTPGGTTHEVSLNPSGLALGERLVVGIDLVGPASKTTTFNLFINANYTTTNYNTEDAELAAGSEVYSSPNAAPVVGEFFGGARPSSKCVVDISMLAWPSNERVLICGYRYNNFANTGANFYSSTTFTASTVTEIMIRDAGGVPSSGIDVGSAITVWKFKRTTP